MFVDVKAALDPSRHEVRARFRITGYPHEPWWLHDHLEIVDCCVDGRPALTRRYREGPAAPFSPRVHQVEVAQLGAILELEVVGVIPDLEAEVNCLAPELTELALYVGWHPVFVTYPPFEFTLDLRIAGDGPLAVNALRCDDGFDGGSRWRSVSSAIDIALVTSPAFVEVRHDRLPVRALTTAVSGQAAAHLVALVGSAMEACRSWWGPTRGSLDAVTVVLSPRAGWAYSRLPLVLLPGGTGTTPETMHTVLHETGHLWWRIARPLSGDDWLNEGLAEYTANRLARDLLPHDFTQGRLTATLAEIAAHSDDEPVLESTHESSAGHRNRYLRPAVALDVIERRVGAAALDRVLGAWLDAATDRPLATSAALAMLEHHVGLDVAEYLRDALTTAGWHPRGVAG